MAQFETDAERARALWLGTVINGFPTPAGVSLAADPLPAYVNRDRWVVDCPWCRNGMFVPADGPVWCPSCGCTAVAGQYVRVALPAMAGDIAEILDARPDPYTRNWPLDASIDDLLLDSVNNLAPVPARWRARAHDLLEADWVRRGLADEMAGFNVEG